MGLLEDLQFPPTGMTLGLEPTSLAVILRYVLPIGKAHPLILMGLLRTAPSFALAFEGALLPLRYSEPALSPLFALPRRIAPRRAQMRDLPAFKKAMQSYYVFLLPASQRAIIFVI